MEINTQEISAKLKEKLSQFNADMDVSEVGEIRMVGDGVARIHGLENVLASELLEFPNNVMGMALNLEQDEVGAVLFGDSKLVKEGDLVKRTGKVVEIGVGKEFLGRVVNPLGEPVDGKGEIKSNASLPIERKATGVISRHPVHEPLQTGLKAVDAMIPIGRGQRELIIGDRQTGKTAIAIDTIINQKETHNTDKPVFCIYVAVGQKESTVARVVAELESSGAMDYTTVITASAMEPAPLLFLAPYTGATLADYYRDNGMHALVIYDDLSKHAAAYRQMSLLLRRPPGREAYPGDVFYLHSRLLERSAKLSKEHGSGSSTALPIIETQEGDVSAYIPTNVISITDGQIYLENNLFNSGQRPAVDVGLSVSRVGGAAQIKAMKKTAGTLKLDLAQFRELEAFAKFGSDLDKSTQQQLTRGAILMEILKQKQYSPVAVEKQVAIIFAGTNGYLDEIDIARIGEFEEKFMDFLDSSCSDLMADIKSSGEISDDSKTALQIKIEEFVKGF